MEHHHSYNPPWDPPPPPPPPHPDHWVGPPFPHNHNHHHNHNNHHNNNHNQLDFLFDAPPPPPPPPPPRNPPYPPPANCGVSVGGGFTNPGFHRKRKFDGLESFNYVKLYAVNIPRSVPEEEVRHLFEEHGKVIEVVILTDRKSGLRHEYCFVKYASVEEAEKAIVALHSQFTFLGAAFPLRVRYADGEKKRLGLDHIVSQDPPLSKSVPGPVQHGPPLSAHSVPGPMLHGPPSSAHSVPGPVQQGPPLSAQSDRGPVQQGLPLSGPSLPSPAHHDLPFSGPVPREAEHKVFVIGLNREASKEEIHEIFSPFGVVNDIFIMRDEMKRNRDCGFVGFSHRCMAQAAINGLNGHYVMRGCNKPLIVRFATPKKPKNGNTRSVQSSVDTQRNNLSNGFLLGNSSACSKLNSTGLQTGIPSSVANQLCIPSGEMSQPLPGKLFSPSRLSQMSLQEPHFGQMSSQSARPLDSQLQAPVHVNQALNGVAELQLVHQSPQAFREHDVNSAMTSSGPVYCAISGGDSLETLIDCDWSEHICPDGHKYYFNSLTCDSKWEKPEEFVIYERKLQRQQLQYQSFDKPSEFSTSELPPGEGDHDTEMARHERKPCDSEKLLLSVPCAVEHSNEQVQDETCSLGQPALVQ